MATLDHISRRPAGLTSLRLRILASAGLTTCTKRAAATTHATIPPITQASEKSPFSGFKASAAAPRNGTGSTSHSVQPREAK